MSTFVEAIEAALATPNPTPRFREGQKVRVRRTLDANVHSVRELLGETGVVEKITFGTFSRRVWYDVLFSNGRCEPFEEDELDWRYIRKGDPDA